jgi:anti-sigma factor RsiW
MKNQESDFFRAMMCTEISQQLPEYVQGRLSADQRALIAEHVARCPTCAGELADLQEFSQALRRQGAVLLEDHLDAEVLVQYAWNQEALGPHLRYQVERHLALCDTCRLEHKVLLRVNESLPMAQVPVAPEVLPAHPELVERNVGMMAPLRTGIRFLTVSGPRWHTLALAAVVLVAISAMLTMYLLRQQPPAEIYRGGREATDVEARFPLGQISMPPDILSWKPVPGARVYRVSLYNSTMERVWQSQQVTSTSVQLPADVLEGLSPGQRYFWQVTVNLNRGQVIKSRVFEFTLK